MLLLLSEAPSIDALSIDLSVETLGNDWRDFRLIAPKPAWVDQLESDHSRPLWTWIFMRAMLASFSRILLFYLVGISDQKNKN